MTEPSPAEAHQGSGFRQRPSELLRTFASDPALPRPDEVERLVSELDIRHRELEAQNQKLQATQRRLEAYRDRYVDLYDFAPLGYVTLDEDGYVQEMNLAAARMLGGERAELVGYPLADFVVKADRAAFFEHVRKCCGQRQETTSEMALFAKDGRSVVVQLHSVPVQALEGDATFGKTAITDISDRKRAEEAIQEERNLLRTLIDNLPDAVYVKDTQGRFVTANLAAARITGAAAPSDLLGKSDSDFYPEEAVAEYLSDERELLRSGEPLVDKDEPHLDPQGNLRTVLTTKLPLKDSRGTVVGLVGISRDVTDRRRAEKAIRESEQRLQLALESAELGWWSWDFAAGLIEGDNKTQSLLGSADVTVPLEGILARMHPDDRPWFQQRSVELLSRAGNYEVEFRVVWPDGSIRWVSVRGRSFAGAEGKPVRAVGIAMDITERKRAEEDLAAAKASAEQANRAKDHFLAVLSHELRTPLMPVVMGISMLQDRPDLDPAMRETLDMVRRNAEMEARLIDDLLDVTRIARGKIEMTRSPIELSTVIQRAVEVCKPDIDARRLEFGVDWGPSASYWIEADVPRLEQVFWNLLRNAIKFTPHGGCVGIRCRPDAAHVIIEVNDSGIGIEPEAHARVFNAFEQVEQSITRQFGGLGLGLAISKALVEMHGGTISAHSAGKGKGATFRIRLPLVAPAGSPEASPSAAPRQHAAGPLRILLVEDHGVTAKMMQMILTAEGHTVEMAGDVATGLELASQHGFDLLISDLGLPDGSGHDLMRELRLRGHKFPGIALSGYGQEDDIHRSSQAGFAAHLTKPASREAIVGAVAVAVATPATTGR